VNVKYKTKNNNTDWNPDFLARKNQKNTKKSSRRNFRLIETRLCKVWLSGFFDCPLKKITKDISEIRIKNNDRITIS